MRWWGTGRGTGGLKPLAPEPPICGGGGGGGWWLAPAEIDGLWVGGGGGGRGWRT